MKLAIDSGGLLTTVQDLGRWGFQGKGMPVAGAMDRQSLRLGNVLVGNPIGAAALEITVLGPKLTVTDGEGLLAVTGADLGLTINNRSVPMWEALFVTAGDVITFSGPKGKGCRAYLCLSGGLDVPLVMGSRSTYLRGKIGGYRGRALKTGDCLRTNAASLVQAGMGFACPEPLRPLFAPSTPLHVVLGPQDKAFTPSGVETFLSASYVISNEADRMGYRLEGPAIEHASEADIISDAIPLGSIQIPGQGRPICMLADRQTTGGYTKIAVLASPDIGALAQRLPGETVRFKAIAFDEAIDAARVEGKAVETLLTLRSSYRSRPLQTSKSGTWRIRVDGKPYDVSWELLNG